MSAEVRTKMDDAKSYVDAMSRAIEHVAFLRRMAELSDVDMVELDGCIDKACAEAHEKFEAMGHVEIAVYGLMDIIKSGHGEELVRDILGSLEGE